jgi:hypothetical protein
MGRVNYFGIANEVRSGWLRIWVVCKVHTTPQQRQLSHCSSRLQTIRRHELLLLRSLLRNHIGGRFMVCFRCSIYMLCCTGIPALLAFGKPTFHPTCYQSPLKFLHHQGFPASHDPSYSGFKPQALSTPEWSTMLGAYSAGGSQWQRTHA